MRCCLSKHCARLLLFVLAGVCLGASALAQGGVMVLEPDAQAAYGQGHSTSGLTVADSPRPHVRRTGSVKLSTDIFLPPSDEAEGARRASTASFVNGSLSFTFFDDVIMTMIVDSESRPAQDVLSLSGHLEGRALATLSVTVTAQGYRILFRDLETGMVYKATGDTETGQGEVTEVDLAALPASTDLPARTPPRQ